MHQRQAWHLALFQWPFRKGSVCFYAKKDCTDWQSWCCVSWCNQEISALRTSSRLCHRVYLAVQDLLKNFCETISSFIISSSINSVPDYTHKIAGIKSSVLSLCLRMRLQNPSASKMIFSVSVFNFCGIKIAKPYADLPYADLLMSDRELHETENPVSVSEETLYLHTIVYQKPVVDV